MVRRQMENVARQGITASAVCTRTVCVRANGADLLGATAAAATTVRSQHSMQCDAARAVACFHHSWVAALVQPHYIRLSRLLCVV